MGRHEHSGGSRSVWNLIDGVANGPVVQAGVIHGGVHFLLSGPDYALEFREEPIGASRPLARSSPSYLLDARSEIVPFRPRLHEQERLRTWRDASDDLSVMLVHGRGGQGKTRLAAHFARESFELRWAVADARRAQGRASAAPPDRMTADQPVLVVVDYADHWADDRLPEMVSQLATERGRGKTRVLLLARSADQWWYNASSKLDPLTPLEDPLRLGGFADNDLCVAFAEAVEAFQRELGVPQATIPMPDSAFESEVSPLVLHMSALAATCANREHIPVPARRDLSQFLLHRERRYWADQAPLIEQVAFIATLFGPFETTAAARPLLRVARVADGEADADRILRIYQRLYPPGRREVLPPIRPDRFGEDFIANMMNLPLNAELVSELVSELDRNRHANWPSLERCLTVLGAAGQRQEHVESFVVDLFARTPSAILYGVGDAASLYSHRENLAAIDDNFAKVLGPIKGLSDSDRAAVYIEFLATYLGHLAEDDVRGFVATTLTWEVVRIYRRLSDHDTATYLPLLASALTLLSDAKSQDNRLNHAERVVIEQSPGLEPAREAVRAYRTLARTDPSTYGPKLIEALGRVVDLLDETDDTTEHVSLCVEILLVNRQLRADDPTAQPRPDPT